jgi:hypothetical protein
VSGLCVNVTSEHIIHLKALFKALHVGKGGFKIMGSEALNFRSLYCRRNLSKREFLMLMILKIDVLLLVVMLIA